MFWLVFIAFPVFFFPVLGFGVEPAISSESATSSPAESKAPEAPSNPLWKKPEPMAPLDYLNTLKKTLLLNKAKQPIDPALFLDFWTKWDLVTTRYKPAYGQNEPELRFIYANDIGMRAFAEGIDPFPEGTVFAKIGAHAQNDPIFDNSTIPGPINRVQIMLKKSDDPNARSGWVYALFVSPSNGDPAPPEKIDACPACHLVAKDYDMVFSKPFPGRSAPVDSATPALFKNQFKEVPFSRLAENVRALLLDIVTTTPSSVKLMEMPVFGGSFVESRQSVARFARQDRLIYVLASEDQKQFLAMIPQGHACVFSLMLNNDLKKPQTMRVCGEVNMQDLQ